MNYVCVATYPSTRGRGEVKGTSSKKENARDSPPTFIQGKRLKNPKRGLRILKRRVQELFMHGEGISTLRARHKG